jgi:hypothetical protein
MFGRQQVKCGRKPSHHNVCFVAGFVCFAARGGPMDDRADVRFATNNTVAHGFTPASPLSFPVVGISMKHRGTAIFATPVAGNIRL